MGGVVRGEAAGGVDDAVAGKVGIGGPSHNATHQSGMIGPATQGGDTAIGEHPSARYLADDVVDLGTKGDLTRLCCNVYHERITQCAANYCFSFYHILLLALRASRNLVDLVD